MKTEQWDAVVVGSGLAGLTCALSLAPLKTLVITKTDQLSSGSTPWAQGGVACPINEQDVPSHIQDTLESGAGACDPVAVSFLINHALAARDWVESQGVLFDREIDGQLARGREGAHSQRRILHLQGDSSGKSLSAGLLAAAQKQKHISFRTRCLAVQIILNKQKKAVGLWVWTDKGLAFLKAAHIIFACGGMGRLYEKTTAPAEGTGDAFFLASKAGAVLRHMHYVQFHPTGLALTNEEQDAQVPLLTEALRGEGAVLLTSETPFKPGPPDQNDSLFPLPIPHPLGALGPRDVVARAIFQRLNQGFGVWLDGRKIAHARQHFPTVSASLDKLGWSIEKTLLPVTPVSHYTMGGILTDTHGATRISGLYALGESASTGVHGANRLASNSLLECLVFGRSCGAYILEKTILSMNCEDSELKEPELPSMSLKTALETKRQIQKIMFTYCGPQRNADQMIQGLERLSTLEKELKKNPETPPVSFDEVRAVLETQHLFFNAQQVIEAALADKVSRGAHYRLDGLS